MKFIILTSSEAQQAREMTAGSSFTLDPVALPDGRYILGLEVLENEHLSECHAFLASLPQEEITLPENGDV